MSMFKMVWDGLGKTPQVRVRNLIFIILAVTFMIAVTQNLRMWYNTPDDAEKPCKCTGFGWAWGPAATIEYKKQ